MNWYPILEEYTEQLPNGFYVNKKTPSVELMTELARRSETWYCCAVGSIMQNIVPSWIEEDHGALDAALCHIDTTNNTSLEADGVCFHAAIRIGDMANARSLFDKIAKQIKIMDHKDINNLVDGAINDYGDESEDDDYDDDDDDDDGPCDCEECTAVRVA